MGWARHSEHLHARFHGFHTTSPSQGTYVHGTGTAARVAVVMTVETKVIEATSSVASSADSQKMPSSPSINQLAHHHLRQEVMLAPAMAPARLKLTAAHPRYSGERCGGHPRCSDERCGGRFRGLAAVAAAARHRALVTAVTAAAARVPPPPHLCAEHSRR